MAVARNVFLSLDCAAPAPLAEFWAAMLGGEVVFTTATAVGVRTPWMWLTALHVPDYRPPSWPDAEIPKQIHLDLGVEELEALVAKAERLGARPAPFHPAPDRWRVMFDPAGHPFCLTTQVPLEAQ